MKVGIIAANNLRLSPYVFYYTDIVRKLGIEFEVIVPNRNNKLIDTYDFPVITLKWDSNKSTLLNYKVYSSKVKKYVRNRFDFLIVLTTVNAVFCSWWLKDYKNNYIVDIRDYTHENNFLYYAMEKKAIRGAATCVISSRKFQSFLPKHDYLICHNISMANDNEGHRLNKSNEKIVIGYVGAIAYEEQSKAIMRLISSDDRFEFHVYGTGVSELELKKFAEMLSCERVKFFGAYKQNEKPEIIEKVDLLFNAYGYGTPLVDCALSNKFYDALIFHKPLITSPHTYMAEMGGKMAFSIDDTDKDSLNKLWNWYQELDETEIDVFADSVYEKVIEENRNTKKAICNLLLNKIGGKKSNETE